MSDFLAQYWFQIVSLAAMLIGLYITSDKTQAVMSERLDSYRTNTDRRIDELSAHVEKHNNLIERMVAQEMNTEAQWKRIDELRNDVEALKKSS